MQNALLSMSGRFLSSYSHVKVIAPRCRKRNTSLLEHSAFPNTVMTLETMHSRTALMKVDDSRILSGIHNLLFLHLTQDTVRWRR